MEVLSTTLNRFARKLPVGFLLLLAWILPVALLINAIDALWLVLLIAVALGLAQYLVYISYRQVCKQLKQVRRRTFAEVQQLLRDLVRNQLAIIQLNIPRPNAAPGHIERSGQQIRQSIQQITDIIETLSEESYDEWERQNSPNRA